MTARHTPGPWQAFGLIIRPLGDPAWPYNGHVAKVTPSHAIHNGDSVGDGDANARLIATAPELHEAAVAILKAIAYDRLTDAEINALLLAVGKSGAPS